MKGIPTDKRFVEDYLQTQSNLFKLLIIWLEDFRARFEDFEDSKPTIIKVEEALALYKATVLATKVKLDVERARNARTPKSVLEYGLVFHLDRFLSDVKSGIPTDKRQVDEYLEKQSKINGLLILWLEDFKSCFAEFDEAQETIKQVEDGLALYRTHVLASKVKLDVERSRDARQKDGSVLEYGLEHHLTRFTSEIKKGIPTDKRFIDSYLESLAKEYNLLIQWLEEFRSKLGEYEEAQETIKEVSEALKLYRTRIAASKVKLDVQRAVDARREQGSVLEYGLDHHLTRFVNAVSF
jgi:hypothetical protein